LYKGYCNLLKGIECVSAAMIEALLAWGRTGKGADMKSFLGVAGFLLLRTQAA
jgi:hypothetical protein